MSLLEDVFLEDEAGEAQELERIIEGDEYDERPMLNSNENSEREDEAEEDKRHVDPTAAKSKRVVKNPRVILNPARLTGPRGIQIIPEHFKDFKFKGKGHETEDLDLVLKKLEHWAYRLYPKFEFKDCLKKIETLGNKRPVMVHLTKIRTDQFLSEETVVQKDSSDDETPGAPQAPEEDEFDRLLQQQIELARATPGPGSVRKGPQPISTPVVDNYRSQAMPKATSSPSISEEQKQRMLRNRQLAEERRLARLKLNNSGNNSNILENSTNRLEENSSDNIVSKTDIFVDKDKCNTENKIPIEENMDDVAVDVEDTEDNIPKAKNNRSNVIDSSDDEDGLVINETVAVDVHNSRKYDNESQNEIDNKTSTYNVQEFENSKGKSNNLHEIDNEDILSDIVPNDTENKIPDVINRTENHDVEINEIHTEKESMSIKSDDSKKTAHRSSADSVQNQTDVEEIKINEVFEIDCNDEPTSKQISENNHEIRETETDESTKKTNVAKKDQEIAMMEDIMDIDFSEDF